MIARACRSRILKTLSLWHRGRNSLRRRSAAAQSQVEHRSQFYEAAWREAASALGAAVAPLGAGILEISLGEARTRVRNNYTPLDDPITLAVAGNKPLVYRMLRDEGLPVPRYLEFSLDDLAPARAFLRCLGGHCVVKPAADTGAGHGVTTGVCTPWGLCRAAAAAAAHGRDLLIEEQVPGDVFRLLFLEGELLDAVVRTPPTVVADGASSILGLIERVNAERSARGAEIGQVLISVDLDVRNTLAAQGWRLASVPPPGTQVRLKTVVNDNAGLENLPARSLLCESIVADAARAACAIGARLAGVDVLTADPALPLADAGGAILEINTTPGFFYHYRQRKATVPVALPVLRRLLEIGRPPSPACGAAFLSTCH